MLKCSVFFAGPAFFLTKSHAHWTTNGPLRDMLIQICGIWLYNRRSPWNVNSVQWYVKHHTEWHHWMHRSCFHSRMRLIRDINASPFIAVQVDDTSHISNKCQLAVIIRYVNKKGSVCERFLGFFDVSSDRDAQAITSVIMRVIGNYSAKKELFVGHMMAQVAWVVNTEECRL